MNMANSNYEDQDFEYRADFGRRTSKDKSSKKSRANYSRANRPVVQHNGIHRRRNKRFSW
ncbi:MAG: hypothetical protein DWQ37_21430 [Planctomycetota bacterium]|nr:MAG: hypothetical protein DWQ37_21430 [Planctomycetota bacterium]